MVKKYVIQVKYSKLDNPSLFATDIDDIKINDHVLINSERGKEVGVVVSKPINIETISSKLDVSPIVAKANESEMHLYEENKKRARKALEFVEQEARKQKLNMNFLAAEYLLDASKIIFTYTSDNRVDFRDLLKVLAAELHTRIEFRQIGARDKAKSVGGVGPCGRKLCCISFLKNFDGISINKAKNQQLSLNIAKLSGSCGKLMCCLTYEDETYTKESKQFPPIGSYIEVKGNKYKVLGFNIISKDVKCEGEEGFVFIPLSEIKK